MRIAIKAALVLCALINPLSTSYPKRYRYVSIEIINQCDTAIVVTCNFSEGFFEKGPGVWSTRRAINLQYAEVSAGGRCHFRIKHPTRLAYQNSVSIYLSQGGVWQSREYPLVILPAEYGSTIIVNSVPKSTALP